MNFVKIIFTTLLCCNAVYASAQSDTTTRPDSVTIKQLSAVTINARKKLLEQRTDRLIVNVANNPVMSNSASMLELLQKLPGVTVDNDGRIALMGRQGVTIMLDGKRSYLGAADLANLLRSLPAENAKQVEIIANPSARFDAAGTAGIINIKTKKGQGDGWNARVRGGYGLGNYPKWDAGSSISYSRGKVNTYLNYDYTDRKGIRESDLQRRVNQSPAPLFISEISKGSQHKRNHVLMAGMDYMIDSSQSISITGNYLHSATDNSDIINTGFSTNPVHASDSTIYGTNQERRRFNNWGAGLIYNLTSDSGRQELNVNLDYSGYRTNGIAYISNDYLDAGEGKIRPSSYYQTPLHAKITIKSAQADYTRRFRRNVKLETGLKFSDVNTTNDFQFNSLQGNSWQPDPGRSNQFVYKEQIQAGYVNFHKDWGKTKAQLGLRLENTTTKGIPKNTSGTVNNNYTQLFPSAFLTRDFNDKHQLGLSYSRRITRPDYMDLNPFRFYNDEYSYQEGNPYLKPELTDNVELSYMYNSFLTASLSYGHTNNVITQVTEQDDVSKIMIITTRNLAARNTYGLNLSASVNPAKWLESYFSLQSFYQEYNANGYLKSDLDNGQLSFIYYMSHDITLPRSWSLQCAFDYQSPIASGIFRFKPVYGLDLGVRKTFLKDRLSARIGVYDLFYTRNSGLTANYSNINMRLDNRGESRYVRLSVTYSFKKTNKRTSSRREEKTEENSRVKDRDLR